MFGAVDLYKVRKSRHQTDPRPVPTTQAGRAGAAGADNPTFDLTLIAENNVGFENLKD